jgi:hypothetical protein
MLATMLAWLATPALSTAQERGGDAPARPEKESTTPKNAPPGRGNPANRDAVVGEMKDAEVRHRERLAKIARLRALAAAKNQTERLAALDELERKETARHARILAKQRGRLGDAEFEKVDRRLARGREKSKEKKEVVRGRKGVERPVLPDVTRPTAEEKERKAKEEQARQQEEVERTRKAKEKTDAERKQKEAKDQAERARKVKEQEQAERAQREKEKAKGKPKAGRKKKSGADAATDRKPKGDKPRRVS